MRHQYFPLLAIVMLLDVSVASIAQSGRPRLAVMDFSAPSPSADRGYGDSSRRFWGDPGRMMSELLTTHLAKGGRFEVVERARLYQLLNEKRIDAGSATLGEQAKVIGQELGVQAIVTGSHSPSAYGYEVSSRVVSVADGSILATENALIPADPVWMDDSLAVLAAKLMAPWSKNRGYVLDVFVESDRLPLLMVDLGSALGAGLGRKLEIYAAGEPVIHPVTRENLGTRDVLLATAAIVQTQKEFSYARVLNPAGINTTQAEADADGINVGVERMQRVKLLDEKADILDRDLSVLSVCKYVRISSDVPDAKLLVDTKPVSLSGTSTTVRLDAGTHLVELQVGQLLMSREVTVTKQGVNPREISFSKADLASAVAIKPPEADATPSPATTIARTAPELTPEDRRADTRLLAMLPKPEVIDEQLRTARDENVIKTFEAGLRTLRYGYAKGSRSYLSIAAIRFQDVIRLAPDLALGHFNLGLAKYYLNYLDAAKVAFDRAVMLDLSLQAVVPLLWWDDFCEPPASVRLSPATDRWESSTLPGGIFRYSGGTEKKGLVIALFDPQEQTGSADIVTSVRFRADGPRAGVLLYARRWEADSGMYLQVSEGVLCFRLADGTIVAHCAKVPQLGREWHVAELTVHGGVIEGWLDGMKMLSMPSTDERACRGAIAPFGIGNVDVDWALATRY